MEVNDAMKEAPIPMQELLRWCEANRPDIVGQLVEFEAAAKRGNPTAEAIMFIASLAFVAGRAFQDVPTNWDVPLPQKANPWKTTDTTVLPDSQLRLDKDGNVVGPIYISRENCLKPGMFFIDVELANKLFQLGVTAGRLGTTDAEQEAKRRKERVQGAIDDLVEDLGIDPDKLKP